MPDGGQEGGQGWLKGIPAQGWISKLVELMINGGVEGREREDLLLPLTWLRDSQLTVGGRKGTLGGGEGEQTANSRDR